ncbi:Pumilio-12-like protein [Morus notabilis]|uniref:Pumilio-12-like protein n=1 Tax=Morus notabilis TaxID=981085 RepID=W9R8Z6_9ROSA|nr:pumilio homolog 15 [Morus notabilis]EXB76651.1 Pumilio-12-like protein [Morus notabilis]
MAHNMRELSFWLNNMEEERRQQQLNKLRNLSLSASPSPLQFFASEPLPTTRINSPATPPYSRSAAASNGININENPVHYYDHSHSSRNDLNLPSNLFDDDNDLMIQYSPSHHHSLHHRFPNSQSPNVHYLNHQPILINSPHSLGYNHNGLGSSGLQRRPTYYSQLYNAGYDHQYGRYHDYDNLPRRHQYQRSTPIDVIRGKVVMAAQNQHGSRFLQDKLRHGNPQNINVIFSETKESLWFLMSHQFGHHIVQKLIDVVDDNKLDEILDILTNDDTGLSQVCAHDHGTMVVQNFVGRLSTPDHQYSFASAASQIASSLTKSTNGSAVIYQCLRNFFWPYKKPLLRAIAANCHDIAQDKSGCCILQKCFDEANGTEFFDMLAAPIIENAYTLSENLYGNYVVQHVISMKKQEVNRKIATKFTGKFFSISMNKYGSNVVEKLVKNSGLEAADSVISEILASDSPLLVYQNHYGNFVVQSAIRVIREGQLLDQFIQHVEDNVRQLENHMYGKRVLQAVNARRNRNG